MMGAGVATPTPPESDKRKGTMKVDIRLPGKIIQTAMAQARSTKSISMIEWIRTTRLSIKNSPSGGRCDDAHLRSPAHHPLGIRPLQVKGVKLSVYRSGIWFLAICRIKSWHVCPSPSPLQTLPSRIFWAGT